jgi:hypothetical protein
LLGLLSGGDVHLLDLGLVDFLGRHVEGGWKVVWVVGLR